MYNLNLSHYQIEVFNPKLMPSYEIFRVQLMIWLYFDHFDTALLMIFNERWLNLKPCARQPHPTFKSYLTNTIWTK